MDSVKRVAVHLARGLRRLVDPGDVYLLEAVEGDTRVRLRGRTALEDVRPLGELVGRFEPYGFLRIHRDFAVNLAQVRELRRRDDGREWEVRLEPPVNRVLPVARSRRAELFAAFGEAEEDEAEAGR